LARGVLTTSYRPRSMARPVQKKGDYSLIVPATNVARVQTAASDFILLTTDVVVLSHFSNIRAFLSFHVVQQTRIASDRVPLRLIEFSDGALHSL
jgi:hypothetical protein